MHLCVLFVSPFWKTTPELRTACDNRGLLAVIPISAVETLEAWKPPLAGEFPGRGGWYCASVKKLNIFGGGVDIYRWNWRWGGSGTRGGKKWGGGLKGKIPILTDIFQRGWNHQLDKHHYLETVSKTGWFAQKIT